MICSYVHNTRWFRTHRQAAVWRAPVVMAMVLALGAALGAHSAGGVPEAAPDAGGASVNAGAQAERPAPDPIGFYESRTIAGFTVRVHQDLSEREPDLHRRVMVKLASDLDTIAHRVPGPALAVLSDVEIWVELQGRDTSGRPAPLRGMCCHWSVGWLQANGVLVDKVGDVEILNARDYVDWIDQPFMMLHEMAHAYHWRLADFDDEIERVYQQAVADGRYEQVHRNSVPYDRQVRAYAITNRNEYFAELTEAYFGLNDFFPYSRSQLQAHDPEGFAMIERLWHLNATQLAEHVRDREAPEKPAVTSDADTPAGP